MKKLFLLLLVMVISYGMAFSQNITVTKPAAGETVAKGSQYTIMWAKSGSMDANVKIRLYNSAGTTKIKNIVNSIPNNGSYTMPANMLNDVPVGNYLIRVRTLDNAVFDDGGVFTIAVAPSGGIIIVTNPNSTTKWNKGIGYPIIWTKQGAMHSKVKIRLYNSAGTTKIKDIVNETNNDGNYSIPSNFLNDVPVGNYKVRAKTIDNLVSDDSSVFIIKIAYTTMINPELKVGIIQRFKPDLAPTFSALTYIKNKHDFEGTIWNHGQVEVINPRVKLQVHGPDGFKAPVFYTTIQGVIKPNKRLFFRSQYIVPNLKERGSYNFIITVDPHNVIKESNEGNNRIEFSFEFYPKSDLVVCTSNNKRPRVGYKTQVHAIVKNVGYKQSAPCKLRFYIEKKGANEYEIPALAPGKSFTITREVKWGLKGTKTISAIIDYDRRIKEYRKDNNRVVSSYFVRLPHHKKTTHPPYSICSSKQYDQPW